MFDFKALCLCFWTDFTSTSITYAMLLLDYLLFATNIEPTERLFAPVLSKYPLTDGTFDRVTSSFNQTEVTAMYDRRTDAEKARDEQEHLEWTRMQQEQADLKTAKLRALLDKKKAEAEAGTQTNVRGSVTKLLLPRIDILREATRLGTPITQQQAMLKGADIHVSYNSLRKFIQKHLAAEYRDNLANSRTTGPDYEMLRTEPQGEEKQEIERFLQAEPATQVEVNKGKEDQSDKPVTRIPLTEIAESREERQKKMNDARQRVVDKEPK